MPMSSILQGLLLLLAGTCLRLYGAPTHLPNFNHMQDGSCEGHCPSSVTTAVVAHSTESVLLDEGLVSGSVLNVGVGGGTGPHRGPQGTDSMMETENGGSLHGRFGPGEAGGEAQSHRRGGQQIESTSEEEDAEDNTGGREQVDTERRTKLSFSDPESSDPYTPRWTQKLVSSSPVPSLMFVSSRTSTPLAGWRRDGVTGSSPSEPVLPEIGPNMMSRDDGLESLWTEAVRPAGGKSEKCMMF